MFHSKKRLCNIPQYLEETSNYMHLWDPTSFNILCLYFDPWNNHSSTIKHKFFHLASTITARSVPGLRTTSQEATVISNLHRKWCKGNLPQKNPIKPFLKQTARTGLYLKRPKVGRLIGSFPVWFSKGTWFCRDGFWVRDEVVSYGTRKWQVENVIYFSCCCCCCLQIQT